MAGGNFASGYHWEDGVGPAEARPTRPNLSPDNLVTPLTLAEAIYDILFYHMAVRLAPFIELITHSATVNHGGGLCKEREVVFPNPCYHAQKMFSRFAGTVPLRSDLKTPVEDLALVLYDLRASCFNRKIGIIDALAELDDKKGQKTLLISLVHRGTSGPVELSVEIEGVKTGSKAEIQLLSAEVPWKANTLETPDAVRPISQTLEVQAGKFVVTISVNRTCERYTT